MNMKCILLILFFFVWFNGFSMAPGAGGPSHAYMHQMHGAHWHMEKHHPEQNEALGKCFLTLLCSPLICLGYGAYCLGDYCSSRTTALVERQNELLQAITTK